MLERLPRPLALALAALLAAACAWCLTLPASPPAQTPGNPYTDLMLYRDIAEAVRGGTPYHQAAAELQRAHGYPTRPFITMREPTLYIIAARLGWDTLRYAALALVLANIAAWTTALPRTLSPLERVGAAAGIALGSAAIVSTPLLAATELWCGLLLALALALRLGWRERWWLALATVAAALALRELALPFALLAAAWAAWERRWPELAGWCGLIALFAIGMGFHAAAELAQVQPGDLVSPGWSGGQGLRGVLLAITYSSVWQQVWPPLALLLALLPALGWAALAGRGAAFAQMLLGGYAVMLALFARADNFYWGFLILPTWFAGYALIPRALAQLGRAISSPPR
mgnify:CR=1 FL=1